MASTWACLPLGLEIYILMRDAALDEAGFVVTWGRSLAQCLASSSVFFEVTVLVTSCSVCSIPGENYRPHIWEGERKEKESPQKNYCLQLWGCHARGLSGLCSHLWLVDTHWAQFGWQCVHGLCSRDRLCAPTRRWNCRNVISAHTKCGSDPGVLSVDFAQTLPYGSRTKMSF